MAIERYSLDPSRITLKRFFRLIRSKRLIPSRLSLLEQMNERFRILEEAGIRELGELIKTLGTKKKISAFSDQTGIPADYLALLKREAGSYLSKPFPLSDFPGIPHEFVEALKSEGIMSSRDFFESLQSSVQRDQLSRSTGIPSARLEEILSLCDISRITGVGGVFARVIYEAGIRSVKEFAATDPAVYYRKYLETIMKRGYAAGHFSEEDISYCIDYARVILEIS